MKNLLKFALAMVAVAVLHGPPWALAGRGPAVAPAANREMGDVIEIRVLPLAEVFGDVITLGEIAEMDGFDLDAIARLAAIEVGVAPLPGRDVGINLNHLQSRLAAAGTNTRFKVIMPSQARVTRAAQVLSAERIADAVLAQAEQDTEVGEGVDLQQKLLTRVSDVLVPKGEVQITAVLLGNHMVKGGSRVYRVSASVNGKEAWKASLRVRQDVFQDVVVAKRRIRRHQKITREDLTHARKNISVNRGDPYLVKIKDVIGRLAKRPIGKAQPLQKTLIQPPADVAEGGRVTVLYESGSLVLKAPGVALVQGKAGQFIPVRNLQSGKIVYGILQAGETVKVN